jgi:DNA-binding Lrp family transcriptional regulator
VYGCGICRTISACSVDFYYVPFPPYINLQILHKSQIIIKIFNSHHQCGGAASKVLVLPVKWSLQMNRLPVLSLHTSHHSIYDKQFNYLRNIYLYTESFMPRAFVLLNVESGSEDKVLKQLKQIGLVEESYVSYGVYDLIIKVKADTMEELKEAVTYKIRKINQVRSTLTLIMMEE